MAWPKGAHIGAALKRKEHQWTVYNRVTREHYTNDRSIDENLFEEIGRDLGLGKTTVSEYYYAAKDWIEAETRLMKSLF